MKRDALQQLCELVLLKLENELSAEQARTLDHLLRDNADAQRCYLEITAVCCSLSQHTHNRQVTEKPIDGVVGLESEIDDPDTWQALLEVESNSPAIEKVVIPLSSMPVSKKSDESTVRINRFWLLMAIVSSIAALFLVMLGFVHSVWSNRVVATLVETSHAQWDQVPEVNEFRIGQYNLNQGYARLLFRSGVEVILQAPCQLHLDSSNRMSCEAGTVTAKVPENAHGFTIDTPSSRIIDYGTEFGVLIDSVNQSEIHVFKGEIGVQSNSRKKGSRIFRLRDRQNALTNWSMGVQVGKAKHRDTHFIRDLPDTNHVGVPGKRIDLADIVGGGNGFGTGQIVRDRGHAVGTINPHTGRTNEYNVHGLGEELYSEDTIPKIRAAFCPVDELPYVDGIFIPDQSKGECTVSSEGHVFLQCPDTDGLAVMNIANGWNLQNKDITPRTWSEAHGISMHANLGITFDLQAIRTSMSGIRIDRFTAEAGIPFNSNGFYNAAGIPLDGKTEIKQLDFWVLVDGDIRESRTSIRGTQMVSVDISLDDSDRFLTIIVTDASEFKLENKKASEWDWCFIANPILEINQ